MQNKIKTDLNQLKKIALFNKSLFVSNAFKKHLSHTNMKKVQSGTFFTNTSLHFENAQV